VGWQTGLLTSGCMELLSPSQSPGFLRSQDLKNHLTSTGFGLHTTQLKLAIESKGSRPRSCFIETFGLSGIKIATGYLCLLLQFTILL
jgi:hypothetical protein